MVAKKKETHGSVYGTGNFGWRDLIGYCNSDPQQLCATPCPSTNPPPESYSEYLVAYNYGLSVETQHACVLGLSVAQPHFSILACYQLIN